MKVLLLRSFLLLIIVKTVFPDQWVDPHEIKIFKNNITENKKDKNDTCFNTGYLKRTTNIFLGFVEMDETGFYSGEINFKLSKEDYKFLKKIVTLNEFDSHIQRRISNLIDTSFTKTKCRNDLFTHEMWYSFWNSHFLSLAAILLAFIGIIKYMPNVLFDKTQIISWFLILAYIVDFAFRYLSMIEDKEIDKLLALRAKEINRCHPDKITWFLIIQNWFQNVCEMDEQNYYRSQKTMLFMVTPFKIIENQFEIVSGILIHFGKGINGFILGPAENQTFIHQILAPIFMVIPALAVILIIGSAVFGVSSNLNLGYLLPMKIGSSFKKLEKDNSDSKKKERKYTHHRKLGLPTGKKSTKYRMISSNITKVVPYNSKN